MWGKRQGSIGSSGGSRDSKEGSEVPYSELLPLFRKRQLAHAQDEEQRRGAGPESGEDACSGTIHLVYHSFLQCLSTAGLSSNKIHSC